MAHLEECFRALARQTFANFRIAFVDNDSADGSVEWVRVNVPRADILAMPSNGGFSSAVNAGIRSSTSDYVALLNNDTAVDPRWLESLVEALERNADYDWAASRMTLYFEPELMNAAGDTYSLIEMAGKNRGYRRPVSDYDAEVRVLGACAGAALYRRRLFGEIGLFDEDFFLMAEDTDFNIRATLAGKKCLYVPGAIVRHKLRSSIDTQPEWPMERLLRRNHAIVAAKNFPGWLLGLVFVLSVLRTIRRAVPLRPSNWHCAPEKIRRTPQTVAAELEGFRIGFTKRPRAISTHRVSAFTALRWLTIGTGPV